MRYAYVSFCWLAGCSLTPAVPQAQPVGDSITQPYLSSTVRVSLPEKAEGFGFIVGERDEELYIVTAAHVVAGEPSASNQAVNVYFQKKPGKAIAAAVLAQNPTLDAALLSVTKPPVFSWQPQAYCLPPFERGERVWFIGQERGWFVPLDGEAGELRYREPDGLGVIELSISSVKPGTSGAPLIGNQGIIPCDTVPAVSPEKLRITKQ